MILSFRLSMPNIGSWNGKWTGESRNYVVTRKFGKSGEEKAKQILDKKSYYYNFGDGWGALVSVGEVDAKEAAKLRKKSDGFFGYEWMVESICKNLEIRV